LNAYLPPTPQRKLQRQPQHQPQRQRAFVDGNFGHAYAIDHDL
jgi:hypothetical protein